MSSENLSSSDNKIPMTFWFLIGLALVWNLLGVMAFISQLLMTPEALARLPQAEQDLFTNTPVWANIAFAVAVFGGALGCAMLLLRMSWAIVLFVLSLAAVLVQMYHAFFISNSIEVFGPGGMTMPIMILIIAIALVWYSQNVKSKTWYA